MKADMKMFHQLIDRKHRRGPVTNGGLIAYCPLFAFPCEDTVRRRLGHSLDVRLESIATGDHDVRTGR